MWTSVKVQRPWSDTLLRDRSLSSALILINDELNEIYDSFKWFDDLSL